MKKILIDPKQIVEAALPDAAYQINQVLANAEDGDVIEFAVTDYCLRRDYAMQRFCYLSNNDAGLKSIAFPIIGKKNLVIDGCGASLLGVGRVMPFYLLDSENITLQNFTIDYPRPFFTQGEILEADENSVLLKVDKEAYPYEIRNGVVIFEGEDYSSYFMHGMLEYEPDTKRPAPAAKDNASKSPITGQEDANGNLRLFFPFAGEFTVGNVLAIKHEERYIPAIGISNCKNVTLKNITIRHAGTMGVIAQFSENITLDGVVVATDPASTRVVSANADATHFVNCRGTLLVENCVLESQLDDVINVHGNYLKVTKVLDASHLLVEIPHFQQVGAFSLRDGAHLTICDQPTMLTVGESVLAHSETINDKYYLLTLAAPFAFEEGKSYGIDDTDGHPALIFRNNQCGKNRARGLLLTTTKPILIENNEIDAEGACIKVNSDMHFWYESSAITDLVVRGNDFKRHNPTTWGKAMIDIDPGMDVPCQGGYFHGNILVEGNTVTLGEVPFVYGYSFEQLTIRENTFIVPQAHICAEEQLPLMLENYGSLCVENNQFQ